MYQINLPSVVLLAGALAVSGCATKKYVRGQVSPVDARVASVEKKTTEHSSSISDLENGVSRADEKASEADKKAMAANDAAGRANDAATRAGQTAEEARNLGQQNTTKLSTLERSLDNVDNYKMVSSDAVLFKFGSSELTPDAKEKLDAIAQNLGTMRRYVIEVEGFTDKTGNKNYNVSLSQRRADNVIRYLTLKNVPLRNIHVIGLGAENPVTADNRREANKQSRRVELKLFTPDLSGTGSPAAQNGKPGE